MANPSQAIMGYVEVKSKFDAEFRRFSLDRSKFRTFEEFEHLLEDLHALRNSSSSSNNRPGVKEFIISYVDPKDNDLLPINNTDNYLRALQASKPLLRLVIQHQGRECDFFVLDRTTMNRSVFHQVGGLGGGGGGGPSSKSSAGVISISRPSEFRQVSAIIDVDVVPETCRRVRLLKHGSDRPLGFYIRDGTSVRVTHAGLEKVPGIFISRLVPGGLAESTGLLAVNDEVLEVNGIEVVGKSLDQVTDMMVANSANLIITVKPANQRTLPRSHMGSFSRNSNVPVDRGGRGEEEEAEEEEDEIRDLTYDHIINRSRSGYSIPSDKKQVLHL